MDHSAENQATFERDTEMAFAVFRCPPELLLRPLVRNNLCVPRPLMNLTHSHVRTLCRAAVCEEYNKPLVIRNIPRVEKLGSGLIRVAVKCVGVNFADILSCKGQYQKKLSPPFVPGLEISGEVSEVADNVTTFKKGDRVFGAAISDGFSEEVIAHPQGLWHIPANATFTQAATLVVSYGTAMLALEQRAHIQPGETVLVTAAAGAVGLAAVDIAKNVYNAKVIGAAGGPEKCALLKRKGADHVIDYTKESIREKVKEFTGGKGVNIAFDNVGGTSFTECLKSLAWDGRILVVGFAGGNIPKIPANLLLLKNASAIGVYWGDHLHHNPGALRKSVTDVLDHFEDGKITPTISETFPLEKINEAFEYITSRK
ncbi:quinone oxidoreductase-like protein 2 homolog [Saccoglossus kowalevskii]|uniref:Quinone oxidoreductase-like protein 2 homolog n=1 Tax=Saccoglossus kowalevskii TaxID=10224 RepID=A0ABM0GIG4_SACKO|nr:PREDICTED: quinone oxidoreductase-like protein 2 homolog [Saccoglossus kowalevskii]